MAGAARNFNVYVEFHGQVLGETTFTQLIYFQDDAIAAADSGVVAEAVYNTLWPAIQPLLSEHYILNSIQTIIYQTPDSLNRPRYIKVVNEPGDVTGEALPPYATVVMLKNPDNTTLYPGTEQNMRQGRTGWAGVPESKNDNGLLTDAALVDYNAAFETFETLDVTFGGTPYTFPLGIIRQQNTLAPGYDNPIAKVDVLETLAGQRLGTQNSRKY